MEQRYQVLPPLSPEDRAAILEMDGGSGAMTPSSRPLLSWRKGQGNHHPSC